MVGRGIIYVGGNANAKEPIVYKKGNKWKNNWGMYNYYPSKVKSSKKKNKKSSNGNGQKNSNQNKNSRRKACHREIRKYANELHPILMRQKLSENIYRKYSNIPLSQILKIMDAYYNCCLDPAFAKKGQINTVRLHIEQYLIKEKIGVKTRQKFVNAESSKALVKNGVVNVSNVLNSIHRCYLLDKKVPRKMIELATKNHIFTKHELLSLAQLYKIVLGKYESGTIEQLCLRHGFEFSSKNSKILQKRIAEFITGNEISTAIEKSRIHSNKDLKMTKEKSPKSPKKRKVKKNKGKKKTGKQNKPSAEILSYYNNREEYEARKKRQKQSKMRQRKNKKRRKIVQSGKKL
jgi:predicted transcriptional regulator